ncbi:MULTISPECIES: hypothetical protein [Bacillus cereus group]|uniref:hypothetical protein n=1 Tax=Bacillus cereus group TaxID=86661 RepID=UPI0022DED919|nr:hypothetical protein [Bacillus cereus group sp. TH152-1LC]MDA1674706.1 hypothetical protein [Bacillus cereus group sp. TH152-1LC]
MMIMLTTYEKQEFERKTSSLAKQMLLQDENYNVLLFKVLANFLDRTNPNKLQYSQLNEEILGNSDKVKEYLQNVLKHMADVAVEDDVYAPTYTTGQLAKYFGVSITTINNWISDGRFLGVERTKTNKQARISANTIWTSRTGKKYPVSQIIKDWEEEQEELGTNNLNDNNEALFLINQLSLYETKYGGEFQRTLGLKTEDELTSEESTDASAWKYFIERQKAINVYGNTEK